MHEVTRVTGVAKGAGLVRGPAGSEPGEYADSPPGNRVNAHIHLITRKMNVRIQHWIQ